MLVTGLIFLVVIGLGELTNWANHRPASGVLGRPAAYPCDVADSIAVIMGVSPSKI